MGVQKSRKSKRFTKFSIKKSCFPKVSTKKNLLLLFEKDHFKKTRYFFLRKREDYTSFFY